MLLGTQRPVLPWRLQFHEDSDVTSLPGSIWVDRDESISPSLTFPEAYPTSTSGGDQRRREAKQEALDEMED